MLKYLILPILVFSIESHSDDERAYQHGINFVQRADDTWLLVWSSSGNPPTGQDKNSNWTHNIYYSLINTKFPVIQPQLLISNREAQEPASSAMTDTGYLMITLEDGWNTKHNVAQRYGVYDAEMKPIKGYPQLIQDGGHSGHVAAVSNRFVVFYSDEWIHGGGVDNLGSGDDVIAKIYSDRGELKHTIPVSVGKESRDWWPLVAGASDGSSAMLVWQHFVDGETWSVLKMSMVDTETGILIKKPQEISTKLQYYTYNVTYLSQLKRFLITGTNSKGKGFAQLYSQKGELITTLDALPPVMREAQIIHRVIGEQTTVVQAIEPTGIMVLSATENKLTFVEKIEGTQKWSIAGSDGIFIDNEHLFLVGLSPLGLQQHSFKIRQTQTKTCLIICW